MILKYSQFDFPANTRTIDGIIIQHKIQMFCQ